MRRRDFIGAASGYLLLPPSIGSCIASVVSTGRGYNFLDERFPQARRFTASWPVADRLVTVQGDITPFWNEGLDRLVREQTLELRGVTTESFRFCLQTLSSEHASVESQVSRVDQNLLLWTLSTSPITKIGTHHA